MTPDMAMPSDTTMTPEITMASGVTVTMDIYHAKYAWELHRWKQLKGSSYLKLRWWRVQLLSRQVEMILKGSLQCSYQAAGYIVWYYLHLFSRGVGILLHCGMVSLCLLVVVSLFFSFDLFFVSCVYSRSYNAHVLPVVRTIRWHCVALHCLLWLQPNNAVSRWRSFMTTS